MEYLFPTNPSDDTASGKPELMVQVGHTSKLKAVAFSPDGKQLVTGGLDHSARLWDVETGRELRCFHGHTDSLTAVAFSPDGKQIITGSTDNSVRVWNPRTGKETAKFYWEGVEYLAYSFDGSSVLSREGSHIQAILWNLDENTQLYFDKPGTHHACAAYSPTRHEVLTGNRDGASLWETEGAHIRTFPGAAYQVAFSPDGNMIAVAGGLLEPITVWSREGDKLASFMTPMASYGHLFFLPGNKELLAITSENTVERWDLESHQIPVQVIKGEGGYMTDPIAISTDCSYLVRCASLQPPFELIDLASGETVQHFSGEGKIIWNSVLSHSGNRLALRNSGKLFERTRFTAVWDLSTGGEVFRTDDEPVGFSQDGSLLVVTNETHTSILTADAGSSVGTVEGHCRAIDTKGNRILTDKGVFGFDGTVQGTLTFDSIPDAHIQAVSPDLRLILYGHDKFIWLWDTESASRRWQFKPPRRSTASDMMYGSAGAYGMGSSSSSENPLRIQARFSPDGHHLIVAGMVGGIRRFDVATGAPEIVAMAAEMEKAGDYMVVSKRENPIEAMEVMPDGDRLLIAQENMVSLWGVNNRQLIAPFPAHSSSIRTLSCLPDKNWVLAGAQNTAQLVDIQTGRTLVQLISFEDGTWVVIDTKGRFDTNNLETIKGMHWVMPDDPMRPLPLEIFMRTYFEPRLLSRMLKGESFVPVPDISQINRIQPVVRIDAINPLLEHPEDPQASVSITVESIQRSIRHEEMEMYEESGVWDLHVFRDGQLVATIEGNLLDANEKQKTLLIESINLPRTGTREVLFSAYAFNKDRVKSQTAETPFKLPEDIRPKKGRAYLVSVGVNMYEDAGWNLRFAVNDAQDIQSSLTTHLSARNEYEVVSLQLTSDQETSTATQGHFKAIIDVLAGRQVDNPEILFEIPNHGHLQEARPEDLILFSFAGHGYTGDGFLGEQGAFYFLFSDIGPDASPITPEVLKRTLSSETLTRWLTDVDAGDMIFIIDACHSAASVEGAGFKPGPMGSRGLGQMAYNKGMLIMAASAADDVALESDSLEQGLLTYVLIEEGLNKQKADFGSATFKQEDATIKLQEWLQYAAVRVPELSREIVEGKHRGFSLTRGARGERKKVKREELSYQQPAVFNYRRRKSEIVLWARDKEEPGN